MLILSLPIWNIQGTITKVFIHVPIISASPIFERFRRDIDTLGSLIIESSMKIMSTQNG